MKAISLWQPWASLWLSSAKIHETRHWPTNHRGPLLVHAAKRAVDDDIDELAAICSRLFGDAYARTLPRGALLGVVVIVDCRATQTLFKSGAENRDDELCGDFSEGRFAWQRGGFCVFEKPIPYRGAQGFFNVPDDIAEWTAAPVSDPGKVQGREG